MRILEKSRILVVDDEKNVRTMVKKVFEGEFDVDTASNAEEALDLLKKNKYDLVFLDLDMPVVNGIELLERMKKGENPIPVIMMTTYGSVEEAVKAMKLGAKDIITKPFTQEEVTKVVEEILKEKEDEESNIQDMEKRIKEALTVGDIKRARNMVLELFRLKPSSPIPHFLYSLVNEKEGKLEEAIKHLNASLSLDPSYEPAKRKLGQIQRSSKSSNERKERNQS
ncbi:MAG: response regulator [Thermotoga sp.]|nr:MAG: response regulator [Thermotoga sp.]